MTEKTRLVQGDDLPRITLDIVDVDGNSASIDGCTGAVVHWRAVGGTTVTPIVATPDVEARTVSFDFSGGVLSDAGEFEAEVQLDFSGLKQTLERPLKFKVRPQFA